MKSRTVSPARGLGSWGRYPTVAEEGLSRTLPCSAGSSPARIRNRVDLPAPLTPTRPTTSAGATIRFNPANSTRSPCAAGRSFATRVALTTPLCQLTVRRPESRVDRQKFGQEAILTYATVTYGCVTTQRHPLGADMTPERSASTDLLRDLEQVVEANLNRHMSVAKEWFPHEYVPWSQGTDFDGIMGGTAWSTEQSKMPEIARISLVVNLLTEDNLPSYHHAIATLFGKDGAWGTWVHRWTAEEGRHGIAIRDYLLTSRAVDPVALERARMTHMGTGFANAYGDQGSLHGIAYVSFQELATRGSHRN